MSASLENLRCLSVFGILNLAFFWRWTCFFTHISFNLDHQKGVLWKKGTNSIARAVNMLNLSRIFRPTNPVTKAIKTTRPGFISITPLWRSCAHFTSEKKDTSLFHRKRGRARALTKEISQRKTSEILVPGALWSTGTFYSHLFYIWDISDISRAHNNRQ